VCFARSLKFAGPSLLCRRRLCTTHKKLCGNRWNLQKPQNSAASGSTARAETFYLHLLMWALPDGDVSGRRAETSSTRSSSIYKARWGKKIKGPVSDENLCMFEHNCTRHRRRSISTNPWHRPQALRSGRSVYLKAEAVLNLVSLSTKAVKRDVFIR